VARGVNSRDGESHTRSLLLLVFGVFSLLAALGEITSPWHLHPPLSGPFSVWLEHVLPLLGGGVVTTAQRLSLSPVRLLVSVLFGCVFATPFFRISSLPVQGTRGIALLGKCAGGLLLVLSVVEAATAGSTSAVNGWGWRESLFLAGTVCFGLLLLVMGWSTRQRVAESAFALRALGLVMGLAGISLLSFVLLPIGLLALVGVFGLLGVCYLQEARPTTP
jgi:hypothetical protein